MLRSKPVCAPALSFVIGILAAHSLDMYSVAAAIVLLAALIYMLFVPYPDKAAFVIVLLSAAMFVCGFIVYKYADANASFADEGYVNAGDCVEGTAFADEIYESDNGYTVYLKKVVVKDAGYTISLRGAVAYADGDLSGMEMLYPGCTVSFTAKTDDFIQSTNPGSFDLKDYYRQKGYDVILNLNNINVVKPGKSWRKILYNLKLSMQKVFRVLLNDNEYGLMCTMILGDKSYLPDEIKELYKQGGLSHILAISGLHISLLGMLIYKLLRRTGAGFFAASVPSSVIVLGFVVLCGMGIAMQRALIMYLIMLLSQIAGEGYDSLSALCLAGLIILIHNPLLLFATSFLLSFAAVVGASVIYRILIKYFDAHGVLFCSFLLCFSIQIATIPISLWNYYEFPVYGIILNVMLLPLVPVILLPGIISGLIGIISLKAASIMILPARCVMFLYYAVFKIFNQLPFSSWITGQPYMFRIVIYYVLVFALAFFMYLLKSKGKNRGVKLIYKENLKENIIIHICLSAKSLAAAAMLILFMFAGIFMITFRFHDLLTVTMLDIGQGDSVAVEHKGGTICFFDGGSTDTSLCGKYIMEPFLKYKGYGHVDYWFVSHTDSDHIIGLIELLESGYKIRNLYFAKGMVYDKTTADLIELAISSGTKVFLLAPGDKIKAGDDIYTCIFPETENDFTDKNDTCLVMRLDSDTASASGGFSALFTGDLTAVGEEYLVTKGILDEIDLLKVGHHGSKTSSTDDFLAALRPDECIISAGRNNRYGHPAVETIEALSRYTDRIYCTQDCGAITVTVMDGKVVTKGFLCDTGTVLLSHPP